MVAFRFVTVSKDPILSGTVNALLEIWNPSLFSSSHSVTTTFKVGQNEKSKEKESKKLEEVRRNRKPASVGKPAKAKPAPDADLGGLRRFLVSVYS